MLRSILSIAPVLVFLLYLDSCEPGVSSKYPSLATNSAAVSAGEQSFKLNCSVCHNFSRDSIGPQLRGLTEVISNDWIKKFIKDPQQVISSGDERATQLYNKYKIGMPPFGGLKDEDITDIIAYMQTQK